MQDCGHRAGRLKMTAAACVAVLVVKAQVYDACQPPMLPSWECRIVATVRHLKTAVPAAPPGWSSAGFQSAFYTMPPPFRYMTLAILFAPSTPRYAPTQAGGKKRGRPKFAPLLRLYPGKKWLSCALSGWGA